MINRILTVKGGFPKAISQQDVYLILSIEGIKNPFVSG
jgi:hypothetical protein